MVLVIFTCLIVFLSSKVIKDRRYIANLEAMGISYFEEGNIYEINPELNLNEQAHLLPYDKDVEFPNEKLKFGKKLGAGAFGIVYEATAAGILPNEKETTVAVKMMKKNLNNYAMRALVSELKIMVHLGKHQNVVNLLGAVTENIRRRELMVIVEYCRFGSLREFLVRNRNNFIDQVRDDEIDRDIVKLLNQIEG